MVVKKQISDHRSMKNIIRDKMDIQKQIKKKKNLFQTKCILENKQVLLSS